jgi:hypothetical protein
MLRAEPDDWVSLICDHVMPQVKYKGGSSASSTPLVW